MTKVHADAVAAVSVPPARPRTFIARRILLMVWALAVALPWILQLRSFSELAMRHKISDNLIPTASATKSTHNMTTRCPAEGLFIAGTWWNINPTHFFETSGEPGASVLCHFVIPQYNIHGTYHIEKHEITAVWEAPARCKNTSRAMSYYFYHGSIGYYSFYEEGAGYYCDHNKTAHVISTSIGSSDLNFDALAKFDGASGYRASYYFGFVNSLWLVYRAIILARSFVSCSQYGYRLAKLRERMSLAGAVVFLQHASRIVPHKANNWHRFAILYLLIEGLMSDLFLLIARDGYAAKLQYISLGYNISGLLSVLFEIVESTKLLPSSLEVLIKRLFFNTELAFWGELLFSAAMQHYLTGLNRSSLRHSLRTADAVSHYVWGLVGHAIIVLGQTASILTVRSTISLILVVCRFHSVRVLTAPCCVDTAMSYRSKITKITGYVYRDSRLCYTRDALKAHGLLKMTNVDGEELLLYHTIHWLPASREDLAIIGKLRGEHVEPCRENPCAAGSVSMCDRILGGCSTESELDTDDDVDQLERASLVIATSNESRQQRQEQTRRLLAP